MENKFNLLSDLVMLKSVKGSQIQRTFHFNSITGDSGSVDLSDQLSNFRIIPDYLKVVDFIEEMEGLG